MKYHLSQNYHFTKTSDSAASRNCTRVGTATWFTWPVWQLEALRAFTLGPSNDGWLFKTLPSNDWPIHARSAARHTARWLQVLGKLAVSGKLHWVANAEGVSGYTNHFYNLFLNRHELNFQYRRPRQCSANCRMYKLAWPLRIVCRLSGFRLVLGDLRKTVIHLSFEKSMCLGSSAWAAHHIPKPPRGRNTQKPARHPPVIQIQYTGFRENIQEHIGYLRILLRLYWASTEKNG